MNERRIATVLRVRSLQERIARSEVSRRRVLLDEELRTEAAAWHDVRDRSRTSPHEAARFVGHRWMLEGGVVDASRAAERVVDARAGVDAAIDTWRAEARRLDGIERLAERFHGDAALEEQRRAANLVDDLVVMRRGGRR